MHAHANLLQLKVPFYSDPLGLFVRTEVSPSTITLMTQDQQLLGINSKGQILLVHGNSRARNKRLRVVSACI